MHHNKKSHPIHHFDITKATSPLKILEEFSKMNVFGGGKLGRAFDILTLAKSEGAKIFLSLAGAMVPGGMRKVITDAMRNGLVDMLVTTGANITHDLIEAFGHPHLVNVQYKNDAELRDKGIDRVYDSFVDAEGFPNLEDHLQKLVMEYFEENNKEGFLHTSSNEFMKWLGSKIQDPNSIVKIAYELNIPIYIPVIADSVLGLQIWLKSQFHKIIFDEMRDLTSIQDFYNEAEKACAFMIGGGVPKNYMLQSSLMSSKEYQYGVAITMDRVETGGLSGATLEEAVSWGKFTWEAPKETVYCDATIALPLIVGAWAEFDKSQSKL
ncbi:MAG: Deoxyhypusine synthase-like protein [Candidatus Heimdallarchaeota archaeon LC_2]|nr:MAG: Deoxyhypusine synthase-like protein [Candidatus Heimdallarchaeota archaeon LC_2]